MSEGETDHSKTGEFQNQTKKDFRAITEYNYMEKSSNCRKRSDQCLQDGERQFMFSEMGRQVTCTANLNFMESLISKIKNVERATPSKNKKENKKQELYRNQSTKLIKTNHNIDSVKRKFIIQSNLKNFAQKIQEIDNKNNQNQKCQQIQKLSQQNKEMRQKIAELNLQLQKSRRQLIVCKQQLKIKNQLVQQFQEYVDQREQEYEQHVQKLNSKIQEIEGWSCASKHYLSPPPQLKLQKVVDEYFTPTGHSSNKYVQQIQQLKQHNFALQKRLFANSNQCKKKDQQIQLIRKSFKKNLGHYKQLILKCTSKSKNQFKQRREQLLDTTILQSTTQS